MMWSHMRSPITAIDRKNVKHSSSSRMGGHFAACRAARLQAPAAVWLAGLQQSPNRAACAAMSPVGGKISDVATLDTEWAITEIDRFLHVTRQEVPNVPGVTYFGTVMAGSSTETAERAHVV